MTALDQLAPEDLQRLRRMYENLRGAPGVQQRRDRETLRRVIALLESDDVAHLVTRG